MVRGIPGRRLWFKIRRRDRDYLRLFQQTKRQGFFERLDGFAAASVRSREPTAEKTAPYLQTIRRLWFKPALPHGKGLPKGSPFPWRRDRDLNPGRHHCLTRFRIVRVQPLRHLCRCPHRRRETQPLDARDILQENGKNSNRFCPVAANFLICLGSRSDFYSLVMLCSRIEVLRISEGFAQLLIFIIIIL